MIPIISVDDHVVEPPDLWKRYLPGRFRETGPRVVRLPWQRVSNGVAVEYLQPAASGPEADCWIFGEATQFIPVEMAAIGLSAEQLDGSPRNFCDMPPGLWDPKARVADMDAANIERSLCFPNSVRFCGQVFHFMKDRELALASVKAYNDWIIEEWAGDSEGRLLPVCLIPLWDPRAAADEVRRNSARGARAVAFSELPSALGLPSIHDPSGHWIPFVEACSDTGTVICLHIGSSSTSAPSSRDAPTAVRASITNNMSMVALSEWLFSGLLARFPSLKIALMESQIGWIPFLLERCDRLWHKRYSIMDIPGVLTEPPSRYFSRQVYGCFFADDFGMSVRDVIGVDRITFESDYPHSDTTWPHTSAYLEEVTESLSSDEIQKIARGNAIEMLGLGETLAPIGAPQV